MAKKTSARGNAMPGQPVQYRGDLVPPVTSYAYPMSSSSIGRKLQIPGSTVTEGSSIVSRKMRRGGARGGQVYYYSYGPARMRTPFIGGPGYGDGPYRSGYQPYNSVLLDWQSNPSWAETGYPSNLGLSHRQPQLPTNASGGPGLSTQNQRPLFTGVQQVPRARVQIRTYPTQGGRA